jgi:ubiquinone/menaquinone biosynthesis C-methylase UbiE
MQGLSYFKDSKEFYDERSWGATAIKAAKDLPTLKLLYLIRLLTKRNKVSASLLEIGCGSGRIITSIRDRDKEIRLTGVDTSNEQIKAAQNVNRGQKLNFVLGDGQSLPFPDKSFDYVVIMDFLEHIHHPAEAIREAWRVLKPHGYIYGFIPAEAQPYSIYRISQKIFRRHFKEATCGHIQKFTINQLEQMVGQLFRIVDVKFSYHLFGSIMDYLLFSLLLNKSISSLFWSNNKYYHGTKMNQSVPSHVLNALLTLGNVIAFYESTILRNTRLFATGVHIIAIKSI